LPGNLEVRLFSQNPLWIPVRSPGKQEWTCSITRLVMVGKILTENKMQDIINDELLRSMGVI
jgi:hypothetical protein